MDKDKKDYDKAIADCTKAIQLKPDSYYDSRGRIYMLKGDSANACSDFNKIIKLKAYKFTGDGVSYEHDLNIAKQKAFMAAFFNGLRNILDSYISPFIFSLTFVDNYVSSLDLIFLAHSVVINNFDIEYQTFVANFRAIQDSMVIRYKNNKFTVSGRSLIEPENIGNDFPKWDTNPKKLNEFIIEDIKFATQSSGVSCEVQMSLDKFTFLKTKDFSKPDISPPLIKITSPDTESVIKVEANATDPVIKGEALDMNSFKLTINGNDTKFDKNGNFETPVSLKPGENEINITAVDKYNNKTIEKLKFFKESDLSSFIPLPTLKPQSTPPPDLTPPQITILEPDVTRSIKVIAKQKDIIVKGKATDASGIYEVMVNGMDANFSQNGDFWAQIKLAVGDNTITVKATDTKNNIKEQTFTIVRAGNSTPPPTQTPQNTAISSTGKYYALIIGNNNYKYVPKLQTPKKDAEDVAKFLKNNYGFETKILLDATRTDILNSLNEIRTKLTSNDNLLLYYAGHGIYDSQTGKAYWLPIDAQENNDTNWIIVESITSNIKRMSAKHILVVSDSCYSGKLARGINIQLSSNEERIKMLQKAIKDTSRTLMASGGNEPVADSGGKGHSIFAEVFLRALNKMEYNAFTAEELFHAYIKNIVAGKSDQTPEYNDLSNSGHEGGDFIFIKK